MASIAAACRLSTRAATQQLRNHGARRAFHVASRSRAAQNFNMPALSPTMTEGNIATWKVKEGDTFVAGDVLLEIETDKAQMDVEAQDDGIVAKIIQQDGAKGVQVGTRIAVTAEPGDDLSSLEIPPEDHPTQKENSTKGPAEKEFSSSPKEDKVSSPALGTQSISGASKKESGGKAQKQIYPLYPSVQHLLMENGLPKDEADKIPATGPNGRLLKGDVLSYLGRIEESYPAESSSRIRKLTHLDLSDIKVATPKKQVPSIEAVPVAVPVPESDTEVAVSISLKAVIECQKRIQESIGVFLPISTFIARAAELANENLPRSKTSKPTADELFDAVLGLDKAVGKNNARGQFTPQITAMPLATLGARASVAKKPDIMDILAGKRMVSRPRKAPGTGGAERVIAPLNVFSISVPKGDERRGQVFLERVKSVLEVEPGRLVV